MLCLHANVEDQHPKSFFLSDSQSEPSGIFVRIGGQSHLEHRLRQRSIEVETVFQRVDDDVLGQVQAVTVEEAVVRQGVHHGTWAACC